MSQIGTSIFFTISRKKIMFLQAVFSALEISILDIFSSLGIWIPGNLCFFGLFKFLNLDEERHFRPKQSARKFLYFHDWLFAIWAALDDRSPKSRILCSVLFRYHMS